MKQSRSLISIRVIGISVSGVHITWKRRLSCEYSRRLLRQNIANYYPKYLRRVVSRCIFRCCCRSQWLGSSLLRHIYPRLVLAALSLQGATCSSGAGIHTYSPTDDPASGAIWGSGASFKDIVSIAMSPPPSFSNHMCCMDVFQLLHRSSYMVLRSLKVVGCPKRWGRGPVLRSARWVPAGECWLLLNTLPPQAWLQDSTQQSLICSRFDGLNLRLFGQLKVKSMKPVISLECGSGSAQ